VIIKFLGGCDEVGREAFLVKDNDTNVLLEYGVELQPEILLPLIPNVKLDGVLISHAHLDHSGMVPLLYKFQTPKLFTTPATLDLMNLLLEDYIKVGKITRDYAEYTKADIMKMNKYAIPRGYNKRFKVGNLQAEFFNAGHIPGSASVFVSGSKNILYTGDINTTDTHLVSYRTQKYPKLDCLITESTYAGREHADRKTEEKRFIEKINDYDHGLVMLPAFAIGRAQELLLILHENNIKRKIYLDGMGQKAADIILFHKNYINDASKLRKALREVNFVKTKKQRNQILRDGGIVITTSGMLNGGPILYYLNKARDFKDACLLITGYQAEGTPGKKLLETGYFENEEMRFKVNVEIQRYNFSGHAGGSELLNLIKKANPKKVICVHGDNTKKFANDIKSKLKIEAIAPKIGEHVEI